MVSTPQTLLPSFQAIPAASQSARVSGWGAADASALGAPADAASSEAAASCEPPQTFAESSHVMPAALQSARVSGWAWAKADPLQVIVMIKATTIAGDLMDAGDFMEIPPKL
jgi:hypothetical protein